MLDQGFRTPQASVSLGVGESASPRRVTQLAEERDSVTSKGQGLNSEQRRIQRLEARCSRQELEKEILRMPQLS